MNILLADETFKEKSFFEFLFLRMQLEGRKNKLTSVQKILKITTEK